MKAPAFIFLALLLAAGPAHLHARPSRVEDPDRPRGSSLVLTLGIGYARYVMPYDAPFAIDRNGVVASGRLLWHPDHRLRFGVESGWTRFYTYELRGVETTFGATDASLSLSAVPLLAVFSMQIHDAITLFAGAGGYFVRSHATSFGTTVDVTRFSQGWMAAISWDYPLTEGVGVGTELKWYGATEFGDGVLALQLRVPLAVSGW